MGCVASNPLASGWRVGLGEPAKPGPQIRGGVSGVITGFQPGLGVDADVPGYKGLGDGAGRASQVDVGAPAELVHWGAGRAGETAGAGCQAGQAVPVGWGPAEHVGKGHV